MSGHCFSREKSEIMKLTPCRGSTKGLCTSEALKIHFQCVFRESFRWYSAYEPCLIIMHEFTQKVQTSFLSLSSIIFRDSVHVGFNILTVQYWKVEQHVECDTSFYHSVRPGQLIKSRPCSSKVKLGNGLQRAEDLQVCLHFGVSTGTCPQHVCTLSAICHSFSSCLSAEKTFHCASWWKKYRIFAWHWFA